MTPRGHDPQQDFDPARGQLFGVPVTSSASLAS